MHESDSNQTAEEILLSSPEEPHFSNNAAEFNNVSVKFAQSNRAILESKKFCIYDNKFLQISSFKNNIKQQYWINLAYLNPRIDRKFIMNKLWLWLFFVFMCFAGITFYFTLPEPIATISTYKTPIAILCLTLAFMSLITLIGKARSVIYLRSANGAIPLVEILYNNPNKAAFNQFLNQVNESMQSAKAKSDFDVSQQLAAELKEHRRLRDEGILSHENYNKAKEIIFSLHSDSADTEKMLPY